jgi:hypothetical protein
VLVTGTVPTLQLAKIGVHVKMFVILKLEAGGVAEVPEDTVYPTALQTLHGGCILKRLKTKLTYVVDKSYNREFVFYCSIVDIL